MWCIHTVVLTAWKKSVFILSDRSAVNAFTRCMLTSLSIDEILLPRYVNLSTNFRGLPLRVEMAPSHLKHIYSVLFALGYV